MDSSDAPGADVAFPQRAQGLRSLLEDAGLIKRVLVAGKSSQ